MIEFDCEGCGVHVVGFFGRETVPTNHFCASCAWLCESGFNLQEFWELYQRIKAREREGRP